MVLLPLIKHLECDAERVAFFINGHSFFYRDLYRRICAIRYYLKNTNIEDSIIGIVLHDNLDTYAAALSLWMDGKAYVPLHALHPMNRNKEIIRQLGLSTIIDSASESAYSGFNVINTGDIRMDDIVFLPIKEVPDSTLAYVLFTSGSTGVPKGVCITRGNLAAFMDSFWKTGISISPEDRCLQCFEMTFDVSIQSFLTALTRGACVYTVPYGQIKYVYAAKLIQEQKITFGALAPSMLAYLRPYFREFDATHMRVCILTAEACPVDLLEDWSRCAVNADLYDFYGPTEATIYCTYYKLSKSGQNLSANGIVSIGKPLANVQAFILDESGSILSTGQKGELCVSGDQITPGYWNSPEKNNASFFYKEIDGVSYRLYHTGDLCYTDIDGNIMYLGRIDQQTKIQGYRVELSEIEFHAREFFHNERRVLAIAVKGEKGVGEIALYIEAHQEESKELLTYLRTRMPGYMIPSIIVYKPIFPLNDSDKIDRAKLKSELELIWNDKK